MVPNAPTTFHRLEALGLSNPRRLPQQPSRTPSGRTEQFPMGMFVPPFASPRVPRESPHIEQEVSIALNKLLCYVCHVGGDLSVARIFSAWNRRADTSCRPKHTKHY